MKVIAASLLLIGLTAGLLRCNSTAEEWTVPKQLVGHWVTEDTQVTVRMNPSFMEFKFTPGRATIDIHIAEDKTVTGTIGDAEFKGTLIKDGMYEVECGSIGKIFDGDPSEKKEVSLWIVEFEDHKMEAELRLTEGGAKFPMAGLEFEKVEH